MKHYPALIRSVLALAILLVVVPMFAQRSSAAKTKQISNLLQQKEFIFRAQTALPMVGGLVQLSPEYELVISTDTLNCQLPYFGRSFTVPTDVTKLGVDFISTDFGYEASAGKRGSQQIIITPHDQREIKYMSLDVSSNGYASLNVIFTNRQGIRYNGYVTSRNN